MKYREFDGLDWEVSALGFGCMRLPTVGGDRSNIDEAEAKKMIHYAIEHGVNYLDSGYGYHGGASEKFLGRALKGGYRERVRLATKMPCWEIEEHSDFEKYFSEQLERLQTDHIDFYLLHGLRRERWDKMRELDYFSWAEKAVDDGRIGHLGFSFHDDFDVFKEIVDGYDNWTFCQIQYNYMDIENQAGTKGLKYAASKGLAVVIMEPLLGGKLVDPPQEVQEMWDSAFQERTPADWALQWQWNQPEVSVVLSGMSTMQQVRENLASADVSEVGSLSEEDLEVIARVREKYEELCPIPCTKCEYCLPCPNELNIPRLLGMFNQSVMYNALEDMRERYERMSDEEKAAACVQCRECEEACPQRISVSEWMVHIHEVMTKEMPLEECLEGAPSAD
jgi:hypothetical protein